MEFDELRTQEQEAYEELNAKHTEYRRVLTLRQELKENLEFERLEFQILHEYNEDIIVPGGGRWSEAKRDYAAQQRLPEEWNELSGLTRQLSIAEHELEKAKNQYFHVGRLIRLATSQDE
jgi:hypothetical protein